MARIPIAELEAALAAASEPPVDALGRIDALNRLAWELRGKELIRAHALAGEARELAIAHRYPLGQARAARTMAMTVGEERALERVVPLAEEARQLFDQVGDGPGRAASRASPARACARISSFPRSSHASRLRASILPRASTGGSLAAARAASSSAIGIRAIFAPAFVTHCDSVAADAESIRRRAGPNTVTLLSGRTAP
ncbi:MAG: hypothetical protein AAFX94_25505 [Myxococcota bacterium]